MPRLQKKCLMASFGMHGLLLFVLLLGSAFFRPAQQTNSDAIANHGDSPVIQMVALPPQSAPAVFESSKSAVASQQISPAQPSQEKQPMKQREGFELTTPAVRTPRISTNLVMRTQQRAIASTHQLLGHIDSEEVTESVNNLLKVLSSGSSIDLDFPSGNGTGGSSYAQIVKETYVHNWSFVGAPSTSPGSAVAKVTIAKSGAVISAVIMSPSGDEVLDRSVQRTLERVRTIEPFESGAKEEQRTYTINFNLQHSRYSE